MQQLCLKNSDLPKFHHLHKSGRIFPWKVSPWVTGDCCDTAESNLTFAVIGVHCSTEHFTCQLWDFNWAPSDPRTQRYLSEWWWESCLIFHHRIVTSIKLPSVFENTLWTTINQNFNLFWKSLSEAMPFSTSLEI